MRSGLSSKCCETRDGAAPQNSSRRTAKTWAASLRSTSMSCWSTSDMGLVGILVALGCLIWLAYRGWSILLLAPAAALIAAAFSREPLLAHWTQTFMGNAAQFIAQF